MQLWEQGVVDLDAPTNDYLLSFRLIAAKASLAVVRHGENVRPAPMR
jgi:CubicO group peptidase (beta-lactamase class C family)